jgi:hypothetical protein
MALAAKAIAANQTSNVVGGRGATGSRNVAAIHRAPVEELSPKVGVSYEDGSFRFQDYGKPPREKHEAGLPTYSGVRLNTSSQTFVDVVATGERTNDAAFLATVTGRKGFAGLLVKAIDTYEYNARTVSGENRNARGQNISLHL